MRSRCEASARRFQNWITSQERYDPHQNSRPIIRLNESKTSFLSHRHLIRYQHHRVHFKKRRKGKNVIPSRLMLIKKEGKSYLSRECIFLPLLWLLGKAGKWAIRFEGNKIQHGGRCPRKWRRKDNSFFFLFFKENRSRQVASVPWSCDCSCFSIPLSPKTNY